MPGVGAAAEASTVTDMMLKCSGRSSSPSLSGCCCCLSCSRDTGVSPRCSTTCLCVRNVLPQGL